MKLEVMEYLIAVEKCGSLSKAAEMLFVSQPNLTNVIRNLEEELGYPILIRSRHGVSFTDEGKQVLLSAHRIVSEMNRMKNFSTHDQPLNLKISIGHYEPLADEICKLIQQTDTNQPLAVTIQNLSVMEATEAVYRRHIDLAYVIIPVNMDRTIYDYAGQRGLYTYSYEEHMCHIILSKDHPILKESFSKEALWNYPFVDFLNQYADAYGKYQEWINPHKIISVDYGGLRQKLIRNTDAYAIGMHSENNTLSDDLQYIPLPDLKMHMVEIRRIEDKKNPVYDLLQNHMLAKMNLE